jgi:hypothetical protein
MLAIVLRFLPLIDAAIATFEGTRRKLVIQDTGANVKNTFGKIFGTKLAFLT